VLGVELDEIENLGTHVEVEASRTLVQAEDRRACLFRAAAGRRSWNGRAA
jgi:adenylate cyclase class IV